MEKPTQITVRKAFFSTAQILRCSFLHSKSHLATVSFCIHTKDKEDSAPVRSSFDGSGSLVMVLPKP